MCSQRCSAVQKVVKASRLTFEYIARFSILLPPFLWHFSRLYIELMHLAPDRYVIAALSGTYLPFRFQPDSLAFIPPHHNWGQGFFFVFFPPKLEIFEGDITVVLIKPKHHVFKGYRQNHLDADLLERQKGAMASALPGNERVNAALKIL